MRTLIANLPKYMATTSAAIIALMPFHAFLTVWLSSGLGHYTLLRLWKEGLLLLMLLGAVSLLITRAELRKAFRREPLLWLICGYAAFTILVGAVALGAGGVSAKAYAYGVLLNTRYLAFFCVTWACSQYSDLLLRWWKQLLLIPAAIVGVFALLEYTVLPGDFLRHFGYGPNTISPTATIDQKAAYPRVESTLRGPNPLGAYLVVILSAVGALLVRAKKLQWQWVGLYLISLLALVFTFSRSAWIGTVVSMALLIWLVLSSSRMRQYLLLTGVVAVVACGVVGFSLRHNDRFQNIFFHTNEKSTSAESSNAGHVTAFEEGLRDIVHMPWGSGTGTAGPASVYNHAPARIAENYYVQIGQEIGLIGLLAFLIIIFMVTKRLWQRRTEQLAMVLLVSFVGLAVVNLLLHAWADDTLAYIWWGLAGAAISVPNKGKAGQRKP